MTKPADLFDLTIIEDNAGGLVLQLVDADDYHYQHTYDDPTDLATDIDFAIHGSGTDPRDWDQNEAPDFWIDDDTITASNGGYKAYTLDTLAALYPDDISGATLRQLIQSLQILLVIPA
jgi:hypothetical protein